MGWIHEGNADYLREAAKAWMEKAEQGEKAENVVCVAPTWEENFALSREIRERLKAEGRLGELSKSRQFTACNGRRSKKADWLNAFR